MYEFQVKENIEGELSIEEVAEDLGISVEQLEKDLDEAEKDFKEGRFVRMEDLADELGVDFP